MNVKGEKISLNKSAEEIFNFLSDFSNFNKIMPTNISKFEASDQGFTFALSGMPEVALKLKEKTPFSSIVLSSAKESLDFSLVAFIGQKEENSSELQLDFNGNFNPFIKMMVEKPLTSFINSLTENLKNLS
jgi:carbon monoxide dehydrogenase subunit G